MSNRLTIQMVDTLEAPQRGKSSRDKLTSPIKTRINSLVTYLFWKGIVERLVALVALVISSPLMIAIAIAIRLDSPGNPIYRREQVGENGSIFRIYKFRTMHINNDDGEYKSYITKYIRENAAYTVDEAGKPVYKVVDDPRITKIGAFLRNTNLDELPQLINILKGEMSLVGPRPDVPFAVEMYDDWQRKRLIGRPGITGLWQVLGRKNLSFKHMVLIDLVYIRRQSLLLDIKILFRTLGTIITRDGS